MIEIEFEKPNYTTCKCCGNRVTWLTRFVYKNNEAIAFYYATFTEHAEEKEVKCLIGICEWENPESEEYTKEQDSQWCFGLMKISKQMFHYWIKMKFLGRTY